MVFAFLAAGAKALGAIRAGKSAKAKGEYDANVADRDAALARDQANALALQQQRSARKTLGAMRAAYGAAGVTVDGSALDVLEESAGQAELDRLTILHNGELKAVGAQDHAALSWFAGKQAEAASRFAAIGSLFSSYGSAGMPTWFGGK